MSVEAKPPAQVPQPPTSSRLWFQPGMPINGRGSLVGIENPYYTLPSTITPPETVRPDVKPTIPLPANTAGIKEMRIVSIGSINNVVDEEAPPEGFGSTQFFIASNPDHGGRLNPGEMRLEVRPGEVLTVQFTFYSPTARTDGTVVDASALTGGTCQEQPTIGQCVTISCVVDESSEAFCPSEYIYFYPAEGGGPRAGLKTVSRLISPPPERPKDFIDHTGWIHIGDKDHNEDNPNPNQATIAHLNEKGELSLEGTIHMGAPTRDSDFFTIPNMKGGESLTFTPEVDNASFGMFVGVFRGRTGVLEIYRSARHENPDTCRPRDELTVGCPLKPFTVKLPNDIDNVDDKVIVYFVEYERPPSIGWNPTWWKLDVKDVTPRNNKAFIPLIGVDSMSRQNANRRPPEAKVPRPDTYTLFQSKRDSASHGASSRK